MMGIVMPETCWAYNRYNKIKVASSSFLFFSFSVCLSILTFQLWKFWTDFDEIWNEWHAVGDFSYVLISCNR